jgi:hypothetical protein
MGFNISSLNISNVDPAVAGIHENMKHYVKNTKGMEPIISENPMDDVIHLRKTSKRARPGFIENIMRIFSYPSSAWDDWRLLKLVTETDFPICNYTSPTNKTEDISLLLSFGLFPTNWNTCIHQAFADQSKIVIFLRLGNCTCVECTLSRMTIQTQLNRMRKDHTLSYNYRSHPGYMGLDKQGKGIPVNWNCNTLRSHESHFHSDAEIIDALSSY